jgi:hypothetical protein
MRGIGAGLSKTQAFDARGDAFRVHGQAFAAHGQATMTLEANWNPMFALAK